MDSAWPLSLPQPISIQPVSLPSFAIPAPTFIPGPTPISLSFPSPPKAGQPLTLPPPPPSGASHVTSSISSSSTGKIELLRENLVVAGDITFDPTTPKNTKGGFGDLFVGFHRKHGEVALKRLRQSDDKHRKVSLHVHNVLMCALLTFSFWV